MTFMQKQITSKQLWLEIDGPCGIDAIPADLITGHAAIAAGETYSLPENATEEERDEWETLCASVRDYTENSTIWQIECREGYGARLSAPGYMDCTEWCVFATVKEAEDHLEETYGDDEDAEGDEAHASCSFGNPGEGGFVEYWRAPNGERWQISNGPYDAGLPDWKCRKES